MLHNTVRVLALAGMIVMPLPLAAQDDFSNFPDRPISFIAMASAGSGFDQLTRAVAATLDQEDLIEVGMPVTNMQSGSVGAQTIATRHVNDPYMMSFNSLSGMMRYATGQTEYSHEDFTPSPGWRRISILSPCARIRPTRRWKTS